ncbi:hypothetical protein D1R32_gp340 [Tunisvirus fontaine2]|uniref:Uncharacterized protein n=1 Tax=Tunisvirus fontaine2 TaxID=1421067 RepID=V9SH08_9VIRU|nr:hypothetical protein D1R32_gp340 [Tunisvirus fontaine2]AHC55057.1 hypothetical protein TNS_ORF339 [Tunisvirus fontaine2]
MSSVLLPKVLDILRKEFLMDIDTLQVDIEKTKVAYSSDHDTCITIFLGGDVVCFWAENKGEKSMRYLEYKYERYEESSEIYTPEFLAEEEILDGVREATCIGIPKFYLELCKKQAQEISELKNRILELEYAPGGEGFKRAREHFYQVIEETSGSL